MQASLKPTPLHAAQVYPGRFNQETQKLAETSRAALKTTMSPGAASPKGDGPAGKTAPAAAAAGGVHGAHDAQTKAAIDDLQSRRSQIITMLNTIRITLQRNGELIGETSGRGDVPEGRVGTKSCPSTNMALSPTQAASTTRWSLTIRSGSPTSPSKVIHSPHLLRSLDDAASE